MYLPILVVELVRFLSCSSSVGPVEASFGFIKFNRLISRIYLLLILLLDFVEFEVRSFSILLNFPAFWISIWPPVVYIPFSLFTVDVFCLLPYLLSSDLNVTFLPFPFS